MAKGNPMLDRIEAKWRNHYNALFKMRVAMMLQMGQDAAMMAAHDVCQLGAGRAVDFAVAYREAINEMAQVVMKDQMDDKQFWYAKEWRDKRIRLIVGEENFAPWEECYPGSK
jgi:hypothetical protein